MKFESQDDFKDFRGYDNCYSFFDIFCIVILLLIFRVLALHKDYATIGMNDIFD